MPTTRSSAYDLTPSRRVLGRRFSSHSTAESILALAGGTNTEAARRYLASESARLVELARRFDATVGIGFGPVVRR